MRAAHNRYITSGPWDDYVSRKAKPLWINPFTKRASLEIPQPFPVARIKEDEHKFMNVSLRRIVFLSGFLLGAAASNTNPAMKIFARDGSGPRSMKINGSGGFV
jgi:hypothetical protein